MPEIEPRSLEVKNELRPQPLLKSTANSRTFHSPNLGGTDCAVWGSARKQGKTKSIAPLMLTHDENQSLPPYITVPVWLKTTRH